MIAFFPALFRTHAFFAYSSDREHSFHAMVNSAWRGSRRLGFSLWSIYALVPISFFSPYGSGI